MAKQKQRGSTAIELALSLLVLMPLLMGTSVLGINLVRGIQVTQFCRDVAHMYAYGVDFSQPGSKVLLTNLAQGLNVKTQGGDGVVLFSTVTSIVDADCLAAGLAATTSKCPNLGQAVFTRRIVVGNSSLMRSHYGTPPSNIVGSDGYISASNYLKNTGARAVGFETLMQVDSGQFAYLTEAYVAAPDLRWKDFMQSTGTYAFNIF